MTIVTVTLKRSVNVEQANYRNDVDLAAKRMDGRLFKLYIGESFWSSQTEKCPRC